MGLFVRIHYLPPRICLHPSPAQHSHDDMKLHFQFGFLSMYDRGLNVLNPIYAGSGYSVDGGIADHYHESMWLHVALVLVSGHYPYDKIIAEDASSQLLLHNHTPPLVHKMLFLKHRNTEYCQVKLPWILRATEFLHIWTKLLPNVVRNLMDKIWNVFNI